MNTTTIARKRAVESFPPALRGEASLFSQIVSSARLEAMGDHPMAVLMRLREEAADQIDRLLAFLDATEGDVDREDGDDDEPWLGFTESEGEIWPQDDHGLDLPGGQDLERDCEDEGAQCDDEGDSSDSGIGDMEGLLEQTSGFAGWQRTVMA